MHPLFQYHPLFGGGVLTDHAPLLEVTNIAKGFGNVQVLKDVDLAVGVGRIVALAGENGAGKSTLMKIMTGIYQPDSGEIRLRGKPVQFGMARRAMDAGIAIIHQELNLLPALSVGENLFLGREPKTRMGGIDWTALFKDARHWLEQLQQDIDPRAELGSLSIAQQQMVEIARALSLDADVIIMDEPTDSLTDVETQILFKVVDQLRKSGKGLVFISHRLGEIFQICDDVAILRDGKMVHQCPVEGITEPDLIRHMVGRELSEQYPYLPATPGQVRLRVSDIHAAGVNGVSFEAHAGEVVGLAGLVGAGRTELAKALYGVSSIHSGQIELDGQTCKITSPADGLESGIGYVTEDRKNEGLIQSQSLRTNMSLTGLSLLTNGFGCIERAREKSIVASYIEAFSIKTHGLDAPVGQLSGGNQQKVSIAKTLIPNPRVLILDEPTRGVDVGAKREIYGLINELKEQGLCILLISSDMPELLGMSDRILVMSEGRLTGSFDRTNATQEAIMRCTVAGRDQEFAV